MPKLIKYNAKQEKACEIFNNPQIIYCLLEGGSRSSKTFWICDYIIARALLHENTRHLICRQSKTSCKDTVWTQTLLDILTKFDNYPQEIWEYDKTNTRINFHNGSSIWAGGFDNKIHEDAVLGSEWATIYVNEALDLNYETFNKLRSRLNWKGINLKLFCDCNPKAPSHWLSKFFKKYIDPKENEPLSDAIRTRIKALHFHPLDNRDNLSKDYLEQLEQLRGLSRKRFWDGEWAEDIEGLVYYNFERKVNVVDEQIKLDPNAETFTTWDFGTADPTFIIIGQIRQVPKSQEYPNGYRIDIIDEYMNMNKEPKHYAEWCQGREWHKFYNRKDYGDPAGKNRDAQLKSWITLLWTYGFKIRYMTSYTIDEYCDNGNAVMPYVRVCEKQCPKFVEMCENWKYPLGQDGKKIAGSKPEHDIFSHPGTAWYYFCANRFGTKQGQLIV